MNYFNIENEELQMLGLTQHNDERSIENLSLQNTFEFGGGLQTKGMGNMELSNTERSGAESEDERAWSTQKCWKCEGGSSAECQRDRSLIVDCPSKDYACEIELRNAGFGKVRVKSQCKHASVCSNALLDNKNQCRPEQQGYAHVNNWSRVHNSQRSSRAWLEALYELHALKILKL